MSEHPAVENLRTCQGQLDEDGTMIAVSRQAVEETLVVLAERDALLRECDAAIFEALEWNWLEEPRPEFLIKKGQELTNVRRKIRKIIGEVDK